MKTTNNMGNKFVSPPLNRNENKEKIPLSASDSSGFESRETS